jgi:hypothetical protein
LDRQLQGFVEGRTVKEWDMFSSLISPNADVTEGKKKLPQACTLVGVPHEAGEVSGPSPHLHEGENNVSETGGVTDKQTSPTLQIYHFRGKKKRDSLGIFLPGIPFV